MQGGEASVRELCLIDLEEAERGGQQRAMPFKVGSHERLLLYDLVRAQQQ